MPTNIEHERRWLIELPKATVLFDHETWAHQSYITQVYLARGVRLRRDDLSSALVPAGRPLAVYTLTVKDGQGASRLETELEIGEQTWDDLCRAAEDAPHISKSRFAHALAPNVTLDLVAPAPGGPQLAICEFETRSHGELYVPSPMASRAIRDALALGSRVIEVTDSVTNYDLAVAADRAADDFVGFFAKPPRVPMIALTGGPCGGKSSALAELARRTDVLVLPEVATTLISGYGLRPGSHAWQRALIAVQLGLEDGAQAEALARGVRAIIVDRPITDGAAFMGVDEFVQMTGVPLREYARRYASIVHFPTLPKQLYDMHKASNPARRETWEEAAAVDHKLFALYRDVRFGLPEETFTFFELHSDCSLNQRLGVVLRELDRIVPKAGQS